MIWNIIDRRERSYRWNASMRSSNRHRTITAARIVTRRRKTPDAALYEQREGISLAKAVAWADAKPYRVTLYLCDEGCGTT
jgi:hypothetical protein